MNKLLGLLCLLLSSSVFAADYYVATTGNDSNPGTVVSPWATIGKAVSTATGGDTVYFADGSYGSLSEISSSGRTSYLVLRSQNLRGAQLSGISLDYGATMTDVYLEFDGFDVYRVNTGNSVLVKVEFGRHARFLNMDVHASRYATASATPGRPSFITGYQTYDVEDIYIERNRIYEVNKGGQVQNANGFTLTGSYIGHKGSSGWQNLYGNVGLLFENNHWHGTDYINHNADNGQNSQPNGPDLNSGWNRHPTDPNGPDRDNSHGSLVSNRSGNVTYRGNYFHGYGSSAGLMWYNSVNAQTPHRNILIENNVIYDTTHSSALRFYDTASDVIIRNNLVFSRYRDANSCNLQLSTALQWQTHPLTGIDSGAATNVEVHNNILMGSAHWSSTALSGNNAIWSYGSSNRGITNGTAPTGFAGTLSDGSTIVAKNGGLCNTPHDNVFENAGEFFVQPHDLYGLFYDPYNSDHVDWVMAAGSAGIGFGDNTHASPYTINGLDEDGIFVVQGPNRTATTELNIGPFSEGGGSAEPPNPVYPQSVWTPLADVPRNRAEQFSVAIGDEIILIGGLDEDQATGPSEIDVYAWKTDTWSTETVTQTPNKNHSSIHAYQDRYIVSCGGKTAGNTTGIVDCSMLDSQTKTWSSLPDLPVLLWSSPSVIVGDKLHMIGGAQDKQVTIATHYVLDLANPGAGWSTLAAIPNPVIHAGAVYDAVSNVIYVLGGEDDHGHNNFEFRDFNQKYDVAANTWSIGTPMPAPRNHIEASTFLWDGDIYVAGGQDPSQTPRAQDDVYVLDPVSDVWTTSTNLQLTFNRVGMSLAVLDNKVFSFAGWEDDWVSANLRPITQVQPLAPPMPIPPPAPPTVSLDAGDYLNAQTVTVSLPTAGSVARYTTDGTTPTATSPILNGPLGIPTSTIFQVVAEKLGVISGVIFREYDIGQFPISLSRGDIYSPEELGNTAFDLNITNGSEAAIAVGLGNVENLDWPAYATTVRCIQGVMDALDGVSPYKADAVVPCTLDGAYRVVTEPNLSAQTYTIKVTPPGGSEIVLAQDYALRTTSGNVTSLNYIQHINELDGASSASISNIGGIVVGRVIQGLDSAFTPPALNRQNLRVDLQQDEDAGCIYAGAILQGCSGHSPGAAWGAPAGLPPGMNWNGTITPGADKTGGICGVPTDPGTYPVAVSCTNDLSPLDGLEARIPVTAQMTVVINPPEDSIPDAFDFTDLIDQAVGSGPYRGQAQILGVDEFAMLGVVNGELSNDNGVTWSAGPLPMSEGETLTRSNEVTASASDSTTVSAPTTTVNSQSSTFSVTTGITATGFTPPATGLVFSLDAESCVTLSGSDVTAACDNAGTNDLIASGAPQIVSDVALGRDVFSFDGVDDALVKMTGATGLPAGETSRSIYMVVKFNTGAATNGGIKYGTAGTTAAVSGLNRDDNGSASSSLQVARWSNDWSSNPQILDNNWRILAVTMAAPGTPGQPMTANLYWEDTDTAQDTSRTYNTVLNALTIATDIDESPYTSMELGAALIYDTAKSGADHDAVMNYLNTYFGDIY